MIDNFDEQVNAPWNCTDDTIEAGRKMWSRAMKEAAFQGAEKRSIAQDSLTLYYGNERHSLDNNPRGSTGFTDIIGRLLEPTAQNTIQMVVDTMVSLTTKNKIRPFFLTERGDEAAREKAQGMMRAVEGVLQEQGMYDWLGKMTAKSGYLWDGGFVKVVCAYSHNKVALMRVFPWEWLVPRRTAKYGRPQEGFHVYTMSKYALAEEYGYDVDEDGKRQKNDLYNIILTAQSAPKEFIDDRQNELHTVDELVVVDGYHLPSGYVDLDEPSAFGIGESGELDGDWPWADAKHDGRRITMIEGHVLYSEPYPLGHMPVYEFFPMENAEGSYGSRGVPETLAGGQLAVERYMKRVDKILDLHAKITLIVHSRAKINKGKLNNDTATILTSDIDPTRAIAHMPVPAVPPDLMNRAREIKSDMLEQYGISPTSLFGEKPPGVDHAPGMEHLMEEQNLRRFEPFEAWETMIMGVSTGIIEACRMLALRDPDFDVMWGDDKELKRIKWKEVELERSLFSIKRQPANLLPQTVAMKMKRLTELAQLDPEHRDQYVRSLAEEYPDMGAIIGDVGALAINICKKLDRIAKNGYSQEDIPHPYINLALAKTLCVQRINKAESDGNDRAMDALIKFWEACDQVEKQNSAASLAAQAAPSVSVQGAPMAGMPPAMPPGLPSPMPAPGLPPGGVLQ